VKIISDYFLITVRNLFYFVGKKCFFSHKKGKIDVKNYFLKLTIVLMQRLLSPYEASVFMKCEISASSSKYLCQHQSVSSARVHRLM